MLENQQVDICIIGAGLTGLLLAYRLEKADKKVVIVESRERIGGRIYTDYKDGLAPVEMGATWLFRQHSQLQALMQELNVNIFEQVIDRKVIYEADAKSPFYLATLPENQEPTYRVQGGSMLIIQALADKLVNTKIYLNSQVKTIIDNQSLLGLTIGDKSGEELPNFSTMILVSIFALIANGLCLYLLQKSKSKEEAHMQASLIFTSNDVIINLGVIVAGILVYVTNTRFPDLVIGSIVFVLVLRGAMRILKLGR